MEQTDSCGYFYSSALWFFFGLKAVQLVDLHNCVLMWHQTTVCLYVTTQCCLFSTISKHGVMLWLLFFEQTASSAALSRLYMVLAVILCCGKFRHGYTLTERDYLVCLTCIFCVHLQGCIRKTGIPVSRLEPFTFYVCLDFCALLLPLLF